MAQGEIPDYYTGFTQAEVEGILATQKAELTKALAAMSEGGTSITRRLVTEINLIIKGCQAALRRFDPETYAPTRRRVFTVKAYGCMER
jgi:hypothetical protein